MMQETHSTRHSFLSLDDTFKPGPEAPAGLFHHFPVYGDALHLDGGDERCLGGMRALVSLILQNTPKEIIHWVQIWATARPFVLGYKVIAVLLQPIKGPFGDMTRHDKVHCLAGLSQATYLIQGNTAVSMTCR